MINPVANISPDYGSFRDMVMRRPFADKIALVRELERETFAERFAEITQRLRSRASGNSITPEEIQNEVEAVRRARFLNR
ncbi:MAG TPA: hypothetical protein VEW28_09675 [Candidatus Kapabacteria bacterium]|nr:hypothetical protein [Candidatus Kapabacteria bacterium]